MVCEGMGGVRCERIGRATLYCGDCDSLIPIIGRVPSMITDPPYGIGRVMKGGTWGAAEKYAKQREWDVDAPQELLERLLAAADLSIVWGGNYFSLPPSRRWLVWDKQNAVPTMSDCELAWCSADGVTKRISLPVGRHEFGHPNEKPLRLMRWCVVQAGRPSVVFDPFMGSGSTGHAAILEGCSFVGCEIDPDYFNSACVRLEDAQRQATLPIHSEPAA